MKILSGTSRSLLCPRGVIRTITLAATCGFVLAASAFAGSRIVNLSTRAKVGTGNDVVIAGVILQGHQAETLVFRGIGPSLPFANKLADPVLQLFNGNGTAIVGNDNWQDGPASEISATGIAPTNGFESAIKINLNPGSYTVILSGQGGGTGIGLIEVYDITPLPTSARLANMSTRARSGNTVEERETMGLIIQGNQNKNLLFRGIGPSMPMSGTLPNPYLSVWGANGGLVANNENWFTPSANYDQVNATGAAPSNIYEAALVYSAAPSSYTAILNDQSGATGIANLEVYDLSPAPTPFPPPPQTLRLVYNNPSYSYGGPIGYSNNDPNSNKATLMTTPNLSPLAAGPIVVNFTGQGSGTCLYGCPTGYVPGPKGTLYPELLNANGTKVAEGGHMIFPSSQGDISVSMSTSFNWTGGPFAIRWISLTSASFPTPDYILLTSFQIYAP